MIFFGPATYTPATQLSMDTGKLPRQETSGSVTWQAIANDTVTREKPTSARKQRSGLEKLASLTMKADSSGGSDKVLQIALTPPEKRRPAQIEALTDWILGVRKLRDISSQEAAATARCLECVKYKPGEVIFIQGDAPAHLSIVVKGSVDIFLTHRHSSGSNSGSASASGSSTARTGGGSNAATPRVDLSAPSDDQHQIRRTFVSYQKALKLFGRRVTTVEKQNLFGELSLIQGSKRTATAVSAKDTYLLQLAEEPFHKLLASSLSRSMISGIGCLNPFHCMQLVPQDTLRALCYCFEEIEFQPRQKLLVQGVVSAHSEPQVLLLAKGNVVEFVDPLFDPEANPHLDPIIKTSKLLKLSQLHAGAILGDACLVSSSVATTCMAVDHVTAYRIMKNDLVKRMPYEAMEYMAAMALTKLKAIHERLSKFRQDGLKFAEEGVRHIPPGEKIPGASGGHVDHTQRTSKSGLALFQTMHVMHGRSLRRLGEGTDGALPFRTVIPGKDGADAVSGRNNDPARSGGTPRANAGDASSDKSSSLPENRPLYQFEPPIKLSFDRQSLSQLAASLDSTLFALQSRPSADIPPDLYRPGASLSISEDGLIPATALVPRSRHQNNIVPPPKATAPLASEAPALPEHSVCLDQSKSSFQYYHGDHGDAAAAPGTTSANPDVPDPQQETEHAPTADEAVEGGSQMNDNDATEPAHRDTADEAPGIAANHSSYTVASERSGPWLETSSERVYRGSKNNSSNTGHYTRLATLLEPVERETKDGDLALGLDELMAAEFEKSLVEHPSAGKLSASDVHGLWQHLVPQHAEDKMSQYVAQATLLSPPEGSESPSTSRATSPLRHSLPRSPRLMSPRSRRSSPERMAARRSRQGVRTNHAREPRDDILDAANMGIPITALSSGLPLEIITPTRQLGSGDRGNPHQGSSGGTRGLNQTKTRAASTLRHRKEPRLVRDPIVASSGEGDYHPAGKTFKPPGASGPQGMLELQAKRNVRIQAREDSDLTTQQVRRLMRKAEEDIAMQGAFSTFYAVHFKPNATLMPSVASGASGGPASHPSAKSGSPGRSAAGNASLFVARAGGAASMIGSNGIGSALSSSDALPLLGGAPVLALAAKSTSRAARRAY